MIDSKKIARWKDAIDKRIRLGNYASAGRVARIEIPDFLGTLNVTEQEELMNYYGEVWKECRISPIRSEQRTWIVTLYF